MKPDGRFCIFDLVRKKDIPSAELEQAMQFTGCLNGIFHAQAYLDGISSAGFARVNVVSEREVLIPIEDGRILDGFWAVGFLGGN